jgi:uncharacterized membrane protein YhhN
MVILLWAEATGSTWFRRCSKTVCSISFCVAGLVAVDQFDLFSVLICLGFLASLCGDVLLLSEKKKTFLLGLTSFLIAHLFYAAGFMEFGINVRIAAWTGPLLCLSGVGVMRWLWGHIPDPMRVAVCVYIGAIMVMVTLAIATENVILAVSAIAFMVSDIAVARQRFIVPSVWNKAWGLPLYFGAQWGFVWSLWAV